MQKDSGINLGFTFRINAAAPLSFTANNSLAVQEIKKRKGKGGKEREVDVSFT